jgi:hypothetical protein
MPVSWLITAYFWLFLAFVLGGLGWVIVSTVRDDGPCLDFALTKRWLKDLLRRGYDGGYLYLEHAQSCQFMRFRKYIRGKGDYGLELRCLGLDWLESAWRNVQVVAERAERPHRVELIETKICGRNAFVIDCGPDTAVAYEIGTSVWTDVFGLTGETPYHVRSGRWSTLDELIDGPDHPPPLDDYPPEMRLKEMDARLRKAGLPSMARTFSGVALFMISLISAVGFPIAMLASRGEAPDWSYPFGAIAFGGSAASLIWLVVLFGYYWGAKRLWPRKARRPKQTFPVWIVLSGQAMGIAFPYAVILAWAGF